MDLPIDIQEEAAFWGHRFTEHAAFLAAGLNHSIPAQASLRRAAEKLQIYGPSFVKAGPKGVARLARELTGVQEVILTSFMPPLWSGWNFPSLLRHMIQEQQWFLDMLEGRAMRTQLLSMASKHDAEAATVLDKMLDPSATPLSNVARGKSEVFQGLQARARVEPFEFIAPTFVTEADGLAAFGGSPEVASAEKAIPLAMVLHEGSETTHQATLLRKIINQMVAEGRLLPSGAIPEK